MAQVVEHVLGKDEVTGSSPVSSSKRISLSWNPFFDIMTEADFMKRICFVIISILLLLCSCSSPEKDIVVLSLGDCMDRDYYSEGYFQDFTHYDKFYYEDVDFKNNAYFQQVSICGKDDLLAHVDDFEKRIASISEAKPKSRIVAGYDLDRSIITDDDYVYIYDDQEYRKFDSYDVYYFDMGTMTLYYFHNNI